MYNWPRGQKTFLYPIRRDVSLGKPDLKAIMEVALPGHTHLFLDHSCLEMFPNY